MPKSAQRRKNPPKNGKECCNQARLLKTAIDNMHQGLCMFDPQGRIAVCNDRYSEIIGLPKDEVRPGVPGEHLIDLNIAAGHFPGMTKAEVLKMLWSSLAAGPDSRPVIERQGRTYSVDQKTTPEGYWIVSHDDITAQIQAETALRDSEARLRTILDSMPDCVKIFNDKGELVYINPTGLELLQAPDLETLNNSGHISVPPEHLDSCLETHRRVLAGESAVNNYEIIGLKGRRSHVEAHATPITLPDGSRAHLCVSRDVTERKKSEDALRRSEERLRLVHEATGLADFVAGPDGVAHFSGRFLEQTGLPPDCDSLTFEEWLKMVHPEDRDRLSSTIEQSLRSGKHFQCEFRIIRADNGEVRWISGHSKPELDAQGKAIRSIGAHLDITERKRAEEALRESEERFRFAAEAAGLGVWEYESALEKQEVSDRFKAIFGLSGKVHLSLAAITQSVHPEDRAAFLEHLLKIREGESSNRFRETFRIHRLNDQAERWVAMSAWKGPTSASDSGKIIITVRDITDEKTADDRIRWNACHDALTGLANRNLFHDVLQQAIARAEEQRETVGLLLLDLDHFKQINDTLGHDAGDALLRSLADRLKVSVREDDVVARLGGDEFAVIIPCLDGESDLTGVSNSILNRLGEPFVYRGQLLDCKVSVGACKFPEHGKSYEELLKSADIALYAAKAAGRAQTVLFRPELKAEVQQRSTMVQRARDAIQRQGIVPYYQPKVDLQSGRVVGFEALLRWRNRKGRIKLPSTIEAAFEDLDVAAAMSDCMIDGAIADMRHWLDKGVPFGHVAVNASAAEFRRNNFAERVLERLRKADIPTRHFQLEVTETVFLGRGADFVHRALVMLSSHGVEIALDDFGTGYASLRHLKQFPVSTIKIDKSFIRDMQTDQDDEAIIRAVLDLGRNLGLKVVAEGIETQSQAESLIGLGSTIGQGFYFSKAIPGGRVPAYVAGNREAPYRIDLPGRTNDSGIRLVHNRA